MTSHSTWMLISTIFRYLHDIPYRPAAMGGLRSNQVIREPHATRRPPRRTTIRMGLFSPSATTARDRYASSPLPKDPRTAASHLSRDLHRPTPT
jgi:hypothetical protein